MIEYVYVLSVFIIIIMLIMSINCCYAVCCDYAPNRPNIEIINNEIPYNSIN
jgi:hypothetical protein